MICIKEIKVVDVDEDFIVVHMMDGLLPFATLLQEGDNISQEMVEVTNEMVHGTRFRNSNGLDVCIGMTQQVQDLIGLPFEAFSNMEATILGMKLKITALLKELDEFKTMGFFGRLKFLFRGYK